MTFPETIGNFTCPIQFPTQGHVTFTEHFHKYHAEILHGMHVHFQLKLYVTFT